MQKGTRAILVIAIVAVLAALAGWLYWSNQAAAPAMTAEAPTTTTPVAAQPTHASLPSGSDTSDGALSQDTAAIDSQMSAFSSDNTSVGNSLSDQPVSQTSL